ncbi:hypothetical protein EDD21DRAFT_445622 [Dissophora ornata]|nr:hypothetical protein BGZ58_006045 [Dissophora ornata]KAI8599114.1 hypothetical protein EDD21DRAFT_445622 [Dissophora ornata]
MAFQTEEIRFDELPTGNLSNIGHSLHWNIEPRDLLSKRSIFSQIFDVKDHPCRAGIQFNQRSGTASFNIRPMTPVSAPEGLVASFEIKIYTPQKKIMVGHQKIKVTFKSMDSVAGIETLLTRSNLIDHPVLVIQIESQTLLTRESPLSPLWDCPSTSDVAILTSLSDQNMKPIFVHKCIVMAAIPNIMNFVKVLKEEPQYVNPTPEDGFNLDGDRNVYDERREDGQGRALNGGKRKQTSDCSNPRGGKAAKDGAARLSNGNPDWPDAKKTLEYQTADTSDEVSTQYLRTVNEAKVAAHSLRTKRDVWLWPSHYTRDSCASIMRWIYLRKASPNFDICSFNSFMDLLEAMNQLQHFQEYALGAAVAIRHHGDALTLLRHVEFAEGYAAKFLRAPLGAALARQRSDTGMIVSVDGKNERKIEELLKEDRTGVVAEMWYRKP